MGKEDKSGRTSYGETQIQYQSDFPGGAVVKNPPANAGGARDASSIPGSGRSPGGANGNPLPFNSPVFSAQSHRVSDLFSVISLFEEGLSLLRVDLICVSR